MAKMQGAPFKALLMVVILAGSGAILSADTLQIIGIIASQHELHIIMDEAMTGGHAGMDMLATQQAPPEFQRAMAFVTMGK